MYKAYRLKLFLSTKELNVTMKKFVLETVGIAVRKIKNIVSYVQNMFDHSYTCGKF